MSQAWEPASRPAERAARIAARGLLRSARALGACLLAGAVAGLLVGGLGGRLVMRILAVAEEGNRGITTDAGFVSGTFSLSGTMELVGFVTVFGLFPFLYAAVHVPLAERLDRYVPAFFSTRPVKALGLAGIAALGISGAVTLARNLATIL